MPTMERKTAVAIREEAARLFFERGYNATSLRDVAAAVGLKVGSLYNHIESKEDLLLQIMGGIIDDLLEHARQALAEATGDAVDRLQAVLGAHLRFHAERAQTVFIGNTELRSLSPDAHEKIVGKRQEYETFLRGLVDEPPCSVTSLSGFQSAWRVTRLRTPPTPPRPKTIAFGPLSASTRSTL